MKYLSGLMAASTAINLFQGDLIVSVFQAVVTAALLGASRASR